MSKLRVEFWKYSSRNRQGHNYHPLTHVRREAILIHWAAGWTEDAIAERLRIDVDTVGRHLRQARKAGDPRAEIRHTVTVYRQRQAIEELAQIASQGEDLRQKLIAKGKWPAETGAT